MNLGWRVVLPLLVSLAGFAWTAPDAGPITSELAVAMAAASPGERLPVTILLASEPSAEERLAATAGRPHPERRRAMRDLLRRHADASQGPLRGWLESRRADGGAGPTLHALWIANVIAAELTPAVIRAAALRPDVLEISLDRPRAVYLDAPAADSGPVSAPAKADEAPVEWGVERIRAPEVWSSRGLDGSGVLVAVVDLGTCWSHPDIVRRVWVNPGEDLDHDGVAMDADDTNGIDDDGNGFVDDFIGWDFDGWDNDPDDQDGHGSHVAGIVAGDGTSGLRTGVAPGARLMLVKINPFGPPDMQTWQAMQYAADNGADVTNSSWGYYHNDNPPRATARRVYDNLVAMGTIPICAAGNGGGGTPPPHQIGTPPDTPGCIAVGAVTSAETIAGFSSQGPTTWEDVPLYADYPYPPGILKPEISAPGDSIRSLDYCSGYVASGGTSMAAPHVAGTVALMLQKKRMSRDEAAEILARSAVDLGSPGWDGAFGAGRIDALAAVDAIAGRVELASWSVQDAGADRGNGDGGLDGGELATLALVARDTREAGPAARSVRAIFSSVTPGVVVHDAVAYFPDLSPGASATSLPPHVTFTVPEGCGPYLHFRIETRADGAPGATTDFVVRLGTMRTTTLFEDDFEIDQGWTATGNTPAGKFVRVDPHQALDGARVSQPEDDHSPVGTRCWVTGNKYPIGSADEDDVDRVSSSVSGSAYLKSPRIDATGYESVDLAFWSWFYADTNGIYDSDPFIAELSNDDGATWSWCKSMWGWWGGWQRQTYSLTNFGATSQMRLRITVRDGSYADTTVDGLLDDVVVTGERPVCEPFTPPPRARPNPVGDTLRLARAGDDVRLTWTAPPVDAAHDAATLYHVTRSSAPTSGFAETGTPSGVAWTEIDEAGRGANWYYLVTAENSGGSETP